MPDNEMEKYYPPGVDGQFVDTSQLPEELTPTEELLVEGGKRPKNDLSDLFEVPHADDKEYQNMIDEEGEMIDAEEEQPEEVLSEEPKRKDNLSDLFETPQPEDNDMVTDHLTSVYEEDVFGGPADMSDLTGVSREDIMGKPLTTKRRKLRMKRTARPYTATPPSMGGLNI